MRLAESDLTLRNAPGREWPREWPHSHCWRNWSFYLRVKWIFFNSPFTRTKNSKTRVFSAGATRAHRQLLAGNASQRRPQVYIRPRSSAWVPDSSGVSPGPRLCMSLLSPPNWCVPCGKKKCDAGGHILGFETGPHYNAVERSLPHGKQVKWLSWPPKTFRSNKQLLFKRERERVQNSACLGSLLQVPVHPFGYYTRSVIFFRAKLLLLLLAVPGGLGRSKYVPFVKTVKWSRTWYRIL